MSSLSHDPEIQALEAIIDRLGPLSADQRRRVLAWACDRFYPVQPAAIQPPAPAIPRLIQPSSSFPPGFAER